MLPVNALCFQISRPIIALCCTVVLISLLTSPASSLACTGVNGKEAKTFSNNPDLTKRSPVIEYNSRLKQLTVNAEQLYLHDVLTAVSEATGIIFIDATDRGCDIVSIRFDSLTLAESLSKLLGERSYVSREDEQGVLTVWLLPAGSEERLTDTDIINEEFYDSLRGNELTEELADQLRKLEQ
jgi:hypothetical protein